jgi:hypothetical protein
MPITYQYFIKNAIYDKAVVQRKQKVMQLGQMHEHTQTTKFFSHCFFSLLRSAVKTTTSTTLKYISKKIEPTNFILN